MRIPNEFKCIFCGAMAKRGGTIIAPSFVSVSAFCPKCGSMQVHRVNDGKRIKEVETTITEEEPLEGETNDD